MTRHIASLLIVLWCIFGIPSAYSSSKWLSVKSSRGVWYTLVEVSSRKEYRLHPRPHLEIGPLAKLYGRQTADVEITLWTPNDLLYARRALFNRKRCQVRDECRVLPYMVERFGIRDQQSHWKSVVPWIFINGALPQKQRFKLRQVQHGSSDCQMCSLVVDMVTVGKVPTSEASSPLTFTPNDLQWAAKILRITLSKYRQSLVDAKKLRLLTDQLMTTKRRTAEALNGKATFPMTSQAIDAVQMALIERSLTYGEYRSHFRNHKIYASGRLSNSATVFVLKNFFDKEGIEIKLPKESCSRAVNQIQISVRITDAAKTKLLGATSSSLINSRSLRPKPEILSPRPVRMQNHSTSREMTNISMPVDMQEQLKRLENLVDQTGQVNSGSFSMANMQKRLEQLENILQMVKQLQKGTNTLPNLKTSESMQQTIQKTASGHFKINDCTDVKINRIKGDIFYLKPAGRLVKCDGKGNLIALSRTKGNVDFNRNWTQYRDGFGDPRTGDYWIGLRYLAKYTANGDRCMRLAMKPWKLKISEREALYGDFQVAGEDKMFQLSYQKYKGNVVKDSFSGMNNRSFSTFDRDNDAFVGNCAALVGGGNWFKFCQAANIFGRHKYLPDNSENPRQKNAMTGDGMCWKGIHPSQGSMCSPLVSVKMMLMKPWKQSKGREVVYKQIADPRLSCKSRVVKFTVNSTGVYHITAGGGSGGMSSSGFPGGRGALIRGSALLKRGQKLVAVIGCGGSKIYSTGDGGNATILFDATTSKPILVAGGGGGAANYIPGSHGLAGEERGLAWWTRNQQTYLKPAYILGRSIIRPGHNWDKCLNETSVCTTGSKVRVTFRRKRGYRYRRYYYYTSANPKPGAGGGGGYVGGESGNANYISGGGGSSFCDLKVIGDCKKTTGGNRHQVGFLIMEKSSCF